MICDFLKGQNFSLFFDIYAILPSFFRRYTDIAVYRCEKIREARHVDAIDHVWLGSIWTNRFLSQYFSHLAIFKTGSFGDDSLLIISIIWILWKKVTNIWYLFLHQVWFLINWNIKLANP